MKRVHVALEDSRQAVEELRSLDWGILSNPSLWRRRYLTAISVIRAVGHILKNVESKKSPAHKQAIQEAWNRIKGRQLFTRFIKADRDSILKEYFALTELKLKGGAFAVRDDEGNRVGIEQRKEISLVVSNGHYKGKDAISLFDEAIEFWETEIDRIERRVAELNADTT